MRIGFDFDGVLCLTPFGRLAVHAPSPVPDLPDGYAALYDHPRTPHPLRLAVEYARFAWRTNAPDAAEVLHEIAGAHEIYIVTGRSWAGEPLVRRWLRSHKLDDRIAGIRMAPPGLRPAQHKLATARLLGIDAHIDDDPRTAYHLAKNGVPRVYLLDHAGAQGDTPPPAHLTVVRSLREFADALASDPTAT
jgi:hypothetical protein